MGDEGGLAAGDAAMPKLPKLKARAAHLSPLEQEYAVSPNSPLLSTTVQNNAWVCGDNGHGQLGISGTQSVAVPQAIQTAGRWAAIAVSDSHAAGLACGGGLFTWGANNRGQLGHGDKCPGAIDAPVAVAALAGVDVKAVAVGLEHTVAVTSKDVYSWGSNEYGQLGHGDHALAGSDVCSRPAPLRALRDVMVTQVACGRFHTICVTAQSTVYAWGHNSAGQLGLGDRRDRHSPTVVDALWALPISQLAAGDAHSAALTPNGHMFSWGSNHFGQLGLVRDGDALASRSRSKKKRRPNQLFLMAMLEMGIPRGRAETALVETGNVGVEVATEWLFAAPESAFAEAAAAAASGGARSSTDARGGGGGGGSSQPGGSGERRHHGHGHHQASDTGSPCSNGSGAGLDEPCAATPKRVPLRGVRYIACGAAHTAAVTHDAVYTWGSGQYGALGHGTYEDRAVPTRVRALAGRDVCQVACGSHHTLFLRRDGAAYGAGSGKFGQLPANVARFAADRTVAVPVKLHFPFGSRHAHARDSTAGGGGVGGTTGGGGGGGGGEPGPSSFPINPNGGDPPAAAAAGEDAQQQQQQQTPPQPQQQHGRARAPVVHLVVAGGNSSAFVTRAPDEMPEVYTVDLLEKLQQAVAKASRRIQAGSDKMALASALKAVAAGVEMVFGSAAAISAAFGHPDRVGLDVELLEKTQASILRLFSAEEVERAAAAGGGGSSSSANNAAGASAAGASAAGAGAAAAAAAAADPSLAAAVADLHKFSMMQSMYRSAVHLLEDLHAHVKLLHTPERAQVLLAAAQNPLLGEHHFAKALLPRLCTVILTAPRATRHLLVKWWSEYPGPLLASRVVSPLQSYLTKELMATKKLTVSVMNAIKVLAKVEAANQVGRRLPPDGFYNALISEKMDVQDHYTAWRQTQDAPGGGGGSSSSRRHGADGPFSFCSYPFLLDPRAKSNLLHIEARFQMEQTVAHARMEQQLYGGGARGRDDEQRVVSGKRRHGSLLGAGPLGGGSGARRGSSRRDGGEGASDDGGRRGSKSGGGGGAAAGERSGLRGLFFNILRSRFDNGGSSSGGNGGGGGGSVHGGDSYAPSNGGDSPRSILEGQLVRREGSMHLPRPADCNMPGTHSDMCIVRVRRNHLVEDALDEIGRQYRRDLFKPLRVHFIGEDGIDAGGVKKEFFQLLVAELLSPDYGMLVYQLESHTYWFNACSLEGEEQFMLLGLVLGLAIYNRVLLDFPLPLALYKKLLRQPVSLRDLEEMQPTLGRSLRQLLQYEGDVSVEDAFCLTFSVEMDFFGDLRTVALKPGGEDVPVTEENRHEYVELMVDYLLNRSIGRQFDAFSHGFQILCDGPAIRLFNACEVERLVCGNPNLDFAALERNAKYDGGFSAASPAVAWLWSIVREELSADEQRLFLKFFTGSDRSPIGGLGALKCVIQRDGPDSLKLPTSHTCFNTLLLPEYASRARMADRLRLAILNAEGFGLE